MRICGLALLFVSFSALACPDLSGTYARCVSASGTSSNTSDVVISQALSGGITTFTVTETMEEDGSRETSTIVADGVPRTESEETDGMVIDSTTTVSCEGSSALMMGTEISMSGMSIGAINVRSTRSGASLVHTMSGNIMGQEINDTITCN